MLLVKDRILVRWYNLGYTAAIVKTAVSIPDPLFKAAERASKRMGLSRSGLYSLAIAKLIEEDHGRGIREALDEVYAVEDSHLDDALSAMQLAALRKQRERW